MSIVNDPVSAPALAYFVMDDILSPGFFVRRQPPSPPVEGTASDGPGIRVQVTSHADQRRTQWDLTPEEWQHVKTRIIETKANVSARVVQAWD